MFRAAPNRFASTGWSSLPRFTKLPREIPPAVMAETHVIEVRGGKGEPPVLELRPGLELAPLSVGTSGAWQVSAAGVRAVHLFVYFDGQTLFLQSAAPDDPPLMDGHP